jgi:hypothetical protein
MVTLFDATGRPYPATAYTSHGAAAGWPLTTSDTGGRNIPPPRLDHDIAPLLSRHKHRLLLADCRYIGTVFPLVSGALAQKRDYLSSAGYAPTFLGEDEAWGQLARAALLEAHQRAVVRGPFLDWDNAWKIGSTLYDIDGDFFLHYSAAADGYPQVQFIEAHRIGSRYGESLVTAGPYLGRRLLNGIIYDEVGRALAYRVLGSTPEQDQDIPAAQMDHCALPRWFSDGRPAPTLAAGILEWYDLKEARGYQQTKQKVAAAHTIVEATEDGKMPEDAAREAMRRAREGGATVSAARAAEPSVLSLDGGLIRYVKAGKGHVSMLEANTPGDSWLRFDETLQRSAFFGMEWRYEMLDLSKLSGAPTRGFQDQINTSIFTRWSGHTRHVLRAELRLLSALIAGGRVPDSPEWMQWGYTPPAEFTVDGGRSNAADLENIRAGIESHTAVIGRYGRTSREVLTEQAKFLRLRADMESKYGLPPGALGSLARPGDPQPAGAAPAAAGSGPGTTPPPRPAAQPAAAAPAAAPATGAGAKKATATAAAAGDVQGTALNGAQVTSLAQIVAQAARGEVPIETAKGLANAAFPLMNDEEIAAIFEPLRSFQPRSATPPAAPGAAAQTAANP